MIIADPLRTHGQRVDEALEAATDLATLRGHRLLRLREWIGVAQWRLFCIDNPDARDWFDEHEDPK